MQYFHTLAASVRAHPKKFLLLPLFLAYFLGGAKTPITFLPVLLAALGLVFFTQREAECPAFPRVLVFSLGFFFIWCWCGLLTGAALDEFLTVYSKLCLYALVGTWVFQHDVPSTKKMFEAALLGLGLVEAAFILAGRIQGSSPQLSGLLRNSLHSGVLLPIAFSLCLLHAPRAAQFLHKALWALLSFFLLAALFYIRSRTALISIGVICVFLFPRKAIWIGVCSVVLLGIFYLIFRNELWANLEIDALSLKSSTARYGIWAAALDAIKQKPWTGYGLGNFEVAYSQFQRPGAYGLRYANSTIFAHNGFLQVASEAGLPAAVAWGAALVAILWRGRRLLLTEKALTIILIVFSITSLFNYSVFLPFNGLIFAMALALFAKRAFPPSETDIGVGQMKLAPSLFLILVTGYSASSFASEALYRRGNLTAAAVVCPVRSGTWYELALGNLKNGQDPMPNLKKALTWNPNNGYYWQRTALVFANFNPRERSFIDEAFGRAHRLMPAHAPFYVQDGGYRLIIGDFDAAQKMFEKAAELEPTTPVPHQGLAAVYKRKGNPVEAKRELEISVRLKKDYLAWVNHPDKSVRDRYRELFGSSYAQFMFGIDE